MPSREPERRPLFHSKGAPRVARPVLVVAIVMLLAGAQSPALLADDIMLNNGKVLRNAAVRSQTPTSVIILHEGGLSSVSKKLLPARLQVTYPIRPTPTPFPVSDTGTKAAPPSLSPEGSRDHDAASKADDLDDETEPKPLSEGEIRDWVRPMAAEYLTTQYSEHDTLKVASEVTLTEVTPVEARPHLWTVRGHARVKIFEKWSQENPVYPFFSGSTVPRTAEEGPAPLNRSESPYSSIDVPHSTGNFRTEMVDFEATFSSEDMPYTLEMRIL